MRLHRKLTAPRLGAMFSPPLSSFESGDSESTREPGQGVCRLGFYGLGRPIATAAISRAMSTRIGSRAFFRFVLNGPRRDCLDRLPRRNVS